MNSMDAIQLEEKIALSADLENTYCELDHSGDFQGNRKAVNYMMLDLVHGEKITIPICEYCLHKLVRGQEKQKFE
jgi:hypothetical protein